MFGMVRPCTHRLGERLTAQWMAHLCGLCLALRGQAGQSARVVTNYDGLVISVLTEAQAGAERAGRRRAGPCPLRGMRTASVAQGDGARLAAAVSLILASAKTRDHVTDRDGILARRPVAAVARRMAGVWDEKGARAGAGVGFDTVLLVGAVERQPEVEALAGPGTPLLTVTEPTETATAAAFAHTAHLAGIPANAAPWPRRAASSGASPTCWTPSRTRRRTPRAGRGTRSPPPAPRGPRRAGSPPTRCTASASPWTRPSSPTAGSPTSCSSTNWAARWSGLSVRTATATVVRRTARRRATRTPLGRRRVPQAPATSRPRRRPGGREG